LPRKHGVTVLEFRPGTVDADYRGEIGVLLINHGEAPFYGPARRRAKFAARMVNCSGWSVRNSFPATTLFGQTDRGRPAGFGSTGSADFRSNRDFILIKKRADGV